MGKGIASDVCLSSNPGSILTYTCCITLHYYSKYAHREREYVHSLGLYRFAANAGFGQIDKPAGFALSVR